ncbi:family 20 glycosylhydrolase [Algoriphagus namhaensis]|uniref:Family 20 glycosylhydrolase n=1 Tax=Algoriphagus namhaensis TaxID=915353 RepID=A0ABV8AS67_9BACT
MNRTSTYLILVTAYLLFSCAKEIDRKGQFELLPSPSVLTMAETSGISPDDLIDEFESAKNHFTGGNNLSQFQGEWIDFEIDDQLQIKSEGYEMTITEKQVRIRSNANEGLWYGLMTLGQLLEDATDQGIKIPLVQIQDEPKLDFRAVHLDVKHHLEKKEYYFELMDRFAALKINGIIIEIEDKLGYQRQPTVAAPDAFSVADWKEISDYAMARNIRMSPLVQGLGHASFILKHPEFADLRDDPASDWAFNPLDEKTYEVQFDLYEDALQTFSHADFLHVGGDEVNTTGRGSGKSPLELQLIWLNRVSEYAENKGVTPIFWDDMPLQNAGLYRTIYDSNLSSAQVDSIWQEREQNLNQYVEMFPKNCIYMRWNYSMPESPGNAKAMTWFTENGFQVMGATAGQTRWNLMPQEQSNAQNILDFAKSSIAQNTRGLLLTLWDDDSPHFELYQRGIATFAEFAWSGDQRSIEQMQQAFRHRFFGYELSENENAFIDLLESPVADWKNLLLDQKDRNRLKRFPEQIDEALIPFPDSNSPGEWTQSNAEKIALAQKNFERVEEVLAKIQFAKQKASRNTYALEVYEQVAQAVQFSNRAILALAELDDPSGEKQNMAKSKLAGMNAEWASIVSNLEEVYGKTRILNKPPNYVLDQDHHIHLANQAREFADWQFFVEQLFLEKLETELAK